MEQEIRRRRGEIFFLWLSVLSVIVGYSLTSTASSDHPNDIWFITGVISGFLGSVLAFGFVLYISICSEYHYQMTVSDKTVPRECPENGKKETVPRECPENGQKETVPREDPENGKESVLRDCLENGKRENVTPEKRENSLYYPLEKLDIPKNNCQQCKSAGKIDLELEKLHLAEYEEIQEILNKATKVLQEFTLIAENFEVHRKQMN